MKQQFLDYKEQSWSPTTYKSTKCRLDAIDDRFLPNDPASCHADLVAKGYSPYTIRQTMQLAAQVCEFAVTSGLVKKESFTAYMHNHKRMFASAYTPKRIDATFEATINAIKEMPAGSREFAIGLLASGVRISEAALVSGSTVIGKGNKIRSVPNADMVIAAPAKSIATFRRDLKRATGLTPHALRKLAATQFVSMGAREAELCAMFGWSSFQTASLYIQAKNTVDMADKLRGAIINAK